MNKTMDLSHSPAGSLKNSLIELKQIRKGELKAKSWKQLKEELKRGWQESCPLYQIGITPQFEKDIKYLKRKKRFTSVEEDIDPIIEELEKGNFVGDEISGIGLPEDEHSYKVRVANSDTKVGKANGYRLIYYVIKDDHMVFLLTVYYKKDQSNISKTEIENLIKHYCT